MPNQDDRRVSKILWSMVLKAGIYIAEQFQWSDVYSRHTGED